jgi:hypothetical protein
MSTAAATENGHRFKPVPHWPGTVRCSVCRLVAGHFPIEGDAPFTAYMSGGVLLGDTLDPKFTPPTCPTPYAPNAGTPASGRSWDKVHRDAARTAVPTPAQARALTHGLRYGARLDDGSHSAPVVAKMRTCGWLSASYQVTPQGAAALHRARPAAAR